MLNHYINYSLPVLGIFKAGIFFVYYKGIVMKYKILAVTTAAALSACSSIKVNVAEGKEAELKTIQRICIISNIKRTPQGYEQIIERSLQNYGIETEIVDVATNRKRLYEPECRYNLRYISVGNPNLIEKVTMILRTPDYSVAAIGYKGSSRQSIRDDQSPRSNPGIQKQTDDIIARLLGKNTQ